MLVLTRKNLESVVVGGLDGFERMLRVTVLGIHGRKVRLGFEVPDDVPVRRSEVWERICARGEAGSRRAGFVAPTGCVVTREEFQALVLDEEQDEGVENWRIGRSEASR